MVLDTNVVSEFVRTDPDARVTEWFRDVSDRSAVTAVTVGELITGVRLLPRGRRRDGLTRVVETWLDGFSSRVLPYDADAARVYAELRVKRRLRGRPLAVEDGMIAAICRHAGATLATRNIKDFAGLGVDLVDPWS